MQLEIDLFGCKVRYCNAISLIEIHDLSFQVKPQRIIIIPKRGKLNKVVFSSHIKQREPSVLKSHGMPPLRHKLPMSLTWV